MYGACKEIGEIVPQRRVGRDPVLVSAQVYPDSQRSKGSLPSAGARVAAWSIQTCVLFSESRTECQQVWLLSEVWFVGLQTTLARPEDTKNSRGSLAWERCTTLVSISLTSPHRRRLLLRSKQRLCFGAGLLCQLSWATRDGSRPEQSQETHTRRYVWPSKGKCNSYVDADGRNGRSADGLLGRSKVRSTKWADG